MPYSEGFTLQLSALFLYAVSLSLSPGDSSRTCLTMHWTKSPTLNSWSKFYVRHSSPPTPSLPQCPAVLFTCPSPQPRALGPSSLVSKPSHLLLVCQKCVSNGASVFCSFRKEVGLDLFFPKQMQENLKVREAGGKETRESFSIGVLG